MMIFLMITLTSKNQCGSYDNSKHSNAYSDVKALFKDRIIFHTRQKMMMRSMTTPD